MKIDKLLIHIEKLKELLLHHWRMDSKSYFDGAIDFGGIESIAVPGTAAIEFAAEAQASIILKYKSEKMQLARDEAVKAFTKLLDIKLEEKVMRL